MCEVEKKEEKFDPKHRRRRTKRKEYESSLCVCLSVSFAPLCFFSYVKKKKKKKKKKKRVRVVVYLSGARGVEERGERVISTFLYYYSFGKRERENKAR